MLKNIRKNNYIPFRESAYDLIKKMILKGELKPGERITESQLCSYLGVSRTPIRESIRRLTAEGLVEVNPKGEARITELKENEIEEIYQIRAVLESFAAGEAASRLRDKEIAALRKLLRESGQACSGNDFGKMAQINTKFHNLIYKAAKNRKLFQIIDGLCTNVTIHRALILATQRGAQESIRDHEIILDALVKRDKKAAATAVFNHVSRAKIILLEKIRS